MEDALGHYGLLLAWQRVAVSSVPAARKQADPLKQSMPMVAAPLDFMKAMVLGASFADAETARDEGVKASLTFPAAVVSNVVSNKF